MVLINFVILICSSLIILNILYIVDTYQLDLIGYFWKPINSSRYELHTLLSLMISLALWEAICGPRSWLHPLNLMNQHVLPLVVITMLSTRRAYEGPSHCYANLCTIVPSRLRGH